MRAVLLAVLVAVLTGAAVGYALTPQSVTPMSRRGTPAKALTAASGPRIAGGPVAVAPVTPLVVTSAYGRRGVKLHTGVDLRASTGTPLRAVGPGTVLRTGKNAVGGLTVVVDLDDGWRAGYAHLSRIDVEAGQRVTAGTRIGLAGATGRASGPHLHFELREPTSMALVDPWPHLNGKAPSYVAKSKSAKKPRSKLEMLRRAVRRLV